MDWFLHIKTQKCKINTNNNHNQSIKKILQIQIIDHYQSIILEHLRYEHNADGDAGHDVGLEIFAPFVSANPTVAGQEQLNPVRPSHPLHLRPPFPEIRRRRRGGGGGGGGGGMLQLDDFDGSVGGGGDGGEVAGAGRGVADPLHEGSGRRDGGAWGENTWS